MPEVIESLILDFLEWLGPEPRPYAEVMDAWRRPARGSPSGKTPPTAASSPAPTNRGRGPLIHRTPLGQQYLETHSRLGLKPAVILFCR